MRVFISSVRLGLESERDALPGLIMATGHEPVRFEDFGAQPNPSREACLRGVRACDVYLLLLGPRYGFTFPETGQSATHDEWVAAVTKGIPKLVFRKAGVQDETEPQQINFINRVRDYGTGVFYDEFTDVPDLMTKVVAALSRASSTPEALTYEPLDPRDAPAFTWRDDWQQSNNSWTASRQDRGVVELHVAPLGGAARPGRVMRSITDTLVGRLREFGALSAHDGVEPRTSSTEAVVEMPAPARTGSGFDTTYPSRLSGVRLDAAGQLSIWWTLPGDSMAAIVDPDELRVTIAAHLRLAGATGVLSGDRFAVAVGLGGGVMMASEGKVTGLARSSVSLGTSSDAPVRVVPDETVSSAAFDRGADEVARNLVESLVEGFRSRR
jgi:uncharacterized protein DUF4062